MARRRTEVIWRAVDGQVVGLDLRSSRYFSLNRSATVLWERLERDATPEELSDILVREYALERAAADRDVAEFLAELTAGGLLEE